MRRCRFLPLLSLALVAIGGTAHAEDEQIGPWKVGPHPDNVSRCIMGVMADDGTLLFAVHSQPDKKIRFMFGGTGYRFAPTKMDNSKVEVFVDGRPIAMRMVPSIGNDMVAFFDRPTPDGEGELLAAMKSGDLLTVETDDKRTAFDVTETTQAVAELNRCLANAEDPSIAAVEAEAEAEAEGEGDGADVEDAAPPPAPAAPAQSASGLDPLGNAMRSLTGRAPPMAQFHCEFSGTDLLGLPDTDGRGGTKSVLVTIATDGSALINGTVLDPLNTDTEGNDPAGAGALVSAVYSARQVIAALESAPGDRAPVAGLTPKQMEAYKMFRKLGSGMIDEAMGGRDRFMLVGLAIDSIAFFDLDGAQQAVNATTPVCIRSM